MNCYFCDKLMFDTKDPNEFKCLNCPHNVYLRFNKERKRLTWIEVFVNNKKYQIIWYIDSGNFAIYDLPDNGTPFIKIPNPNNTINPNNILDKLPLLLVMI